MTSENQFDNDIDVNYLLDNAGIKAKVVDDKAINQNNSDLATLYEVSKRIVARQDVICGKTSDMPDFRSYPKSENKGKLIDEPHENEAEEKHRKVYLELKEKTENSLTKFPWEVMDGGMIDKLIKFKYNFDKENRDWSYEAKLYCPFSCKKPISPSYRIFLTKSGFSKRWEMYNYNRHLDKHLEDGKINEGHKQKKHLKFIGKTEILQKSSKDPLDVSKNHPMAQPRRTGGESEGHGFLPMQSDQHSMSLNRDTNEQLPTTSVVVSTRITSDATNHPTSLQKLHPSDNETDKATISECKLPSLTSSSSSSSESESESESEPESEDDKVQQQIPVENVSNRKDVGLTQIRNLRKRKLPKRY